MRNIGILYDTKVAFNRKKPFFHERYNKDYASLLATGKKYNLHIFLAPYTVYKNSTFQKAWVYKKKWLKVSNVKLNAVLDKVDGDQGFALKRKIDQQLPLINRFTLDVLCTDKWLLYKKWKQYFPFTALGNDLKSIRKIKSDLLIAKPITGASGKGIKIIKKDAYRKLSKHYIVQNLINGGKILNRKGQHDYRVLMGNNHPIYSTLRVPVKKKYISNVGQGGEEFYYPPNKIPKKILKLVKIIDHDLKKYYPRLYSIDFMVNEQGQPFILELNSRPGLTHYKSKTVKKLLDNFVCQSFDKILTKT